MVSLLLQGLVFQWAHSLSLSLPPFIPSPIVCSPLSLSLPPWCICLHFVVLCLGAYVFTESKQVHVVIT